MLKVEEGMNNLVKLIMWSPLESNLSESALLRVRSTR